MKKGLKYLVLFACQAILVFVLSFSNTIVEKEFVKTNTEIAVDQFKEGGNAYQELSIGILRRTTMQSFITLCFFLGTLAVIVIAIKFMYDDFKEKKNEKN